MARQNCKLNKPARLLVFWAVAVSLAFVLPRFFAPPDGVDLAPAAGLVFIVFMLAAFAIAVYAFGHSLRNKVAYSSATTLVGFSPLIVTLVTIAFVVFV